MTPLDATALFDKTASIATLAASLHEINNPLVYVTLGLELIDRELSRMQKATPLPEDWQRVRAYCADSISGAERVRAIVHELGAFCRPVLPAQPLDDAAAVGVAPRGAARRQRLLLIDDEPHLGTTLSTGLRDHADVVAVRSGREAIELLLRDQGFDLILCDLMMPDLTGMDVFEEVSRELPALRGRFVFTTGGAVTERARQFIEEKPDQRLDKPFQLEQVEALLRRPPR
jgi:CheY-like chemotaxis protein